MTHPPRGGEYSGKNPPPGATPGPGAPVATGSPRAGAERLLGKPNTLINANEEMWAFFKNFHR